jgi:hypothetical protein
LPEYVPQPLVFSDDELALLEDPELLLRAER